jgi:hypothetical protein
VPSTDHSRVLWGENQMKHRRKEFVEPLNRSKSFSCRVKDWGQNTIIFPFDQTVRPYIAHDDGAFRQLRNPLQAVQERYNTDLTQVIF